ncbi:acyltransferase [Lactobacillus delbrueckii subsp. bulgaricus]|uniref:acyltransferase n=1 Tax=Lactobacillus delbrueckii TaxID=1584 RepID=UPI003D2EBEC1
MLFLKLWYHINCMFKKALFSMIYGKRLHYGKKFQFRKGFSLGIEDQGRIKIGDDCFFNNYCSIVSQGNVKIGDGSIFGENVKIYDHNHRFNDLTKSIKAQGYSVGTVEIGKHCWIGSNVTLLKGAKIGDNCVIGAGSVINGIIESGMIVKPSDKYEKIKIIPKKV